MTGMRVRMAFGSLSSCAIGIGLASWSWPNFDGRFYGIGSIDEARAYLADPLLGSRLDLCARTVLANESPSLHAIFGSPDDLKCRSCMALFSLATDDPDNPFRQALDRWCGGQPDERTLALIN